MVILEVMDHLVEMVMVEQLDQEDILDPRYAILSFKDFFVESLSESYC